MWLASGYTNISESCAGWAETFRNLSEIPYFPGDVKASSKDAVVSGLIKNAVSSHGAMDHFRHGVGDERTMQIDLVIERYGAQRVKTMAGIQTEKRHTVDGYSTWGEVFNLMGDCSMCNYSDHEEAVQSTGCLLYMIATKVADGCQTGVDFAILNNLESIPHAVSYPVRVLVEHKCQVDAA